MHKLLKFGRQNFPIIALSAFYLFALINPVFKKYDYGGGWPLVILFGVLLLLIAIATRKEKRERNLWEEVPLLIFIVAVALSFIFSETRNVGFSEVVAFTSMSGLYLLFSNRKIKWMTNFLKIVGVGALLSILIGFVLYMFNAEPRMFGSFFNILYHANEWPNAFALFLLIVWPVFLLLSKGKSSVKAAILIAVIFSAIALTFSRGAMIALAGQGVLVLIYFFKKLDTKKIYIAALAIALSVGIFFATNHIRSLNHEVLDVGEKIAFESDEGLTSKVERMDFWKGSIELTKEKPVFGWGPFSFRQAYNGIQRTLLGNSDHPHNVFLKILMENGVIALLAFLAFGLALLIKVVNRFPKLSKEDKDTVYLLGVSIAGATAHNLIDYNFNFIVNIFLLFMFMAFISSIVVKNVRKSKKSIIAPLAISIVVALFSLYEGGLLTLHYLGNSSYITHSFFPRDYYLSLAEHELKNKNFEQAKMAIQNQISLNPLDSQAYYLWGLVDWSTGETDLIEEHFREAITLNPKNYFVFYEVYFALCDNEGFHCEDFLDEVVEMLYLYFDYVENNVHFTAYTQNVEVAYGLIDQLLPYLSEEQKQDLLEKREQMMATATRLREEKTF